MNSFTLRGTIEAVEENRSTKGRTYYRIILATGGELIPLTVFSARLGRRRGEDHGPNHGLELLSATTGGSGREGGPPGLRRGDRPGWEPPATRADLHGGAG